MPKTDRWPKQSYVACAAAISVERGLIHWDCRLSAYDRNTFADFLREIRRQNPGKKMAVFMDNASFHKPVAAYSEISLDIDMEVVFNLAYRPDLMGVERTWAVAKRLYRKFLGAVKPFNHLSTRWDPVATVQGCMEGVLDKEAKRHAELGWKSLQAAVGIEQRAPRG